MPKITRGLPKDFQLNVPVRPIELGDYLDESPALSPRPPVVKSQEVLPETPWQSNPPTAEAAFTVEAFKEASNPVPGAPTELTRSKPVIQPLAARPGGPPRKQFNMTPETLRMVDDLLIHIRHHSVERDVRASELFHALVLAIYEVRPFLDLSRIPPRGRWGSTSAATLPIAMKEAFQDAIARSKQRR